jgi:hypothetical protein
MRRPRRKPTVEVDGLIFRDLDGDRQLTPYKDWPLPAAERAADLSAQRLLEPMFRMGLFEDPYADEQSDVEARAVEAHPAYVVHVAGRGWLDISGTTAPTPCSPPSGTWWSRRSPTPTWRCSRRGARR